MWPADPPPGARNDRPANGRRAGERITGPDSDCALRRPRDLVQVAWLGLDRARAPGVRWSAWSCPATIETIGPSHSGVPAGGGPATSRDRVPRRGPTRPSARYRGRRAGAPTARPGRPRCARPRQREDRHAGFDERERAVLEVGGGIRVGEQVGQLLELERPLARGRVLVASGDDEGARGRRLVDRDPFDLGFEREGRGQGSRGWRRGTPARPDRRQWRPIASRWRAVRPCRSWSRRRPARVRRRARSSARTPPPGPTRVRW